MKLLLATTGVLVFLLGIFLGHFLSYPFDQFVMRTITTVKVFSELRDQALIGKLKTIDWSTLETKDSDELALAMKVSPVLRMKVLQEFQQSTDQIAKYHMVQLLLSAPTPELASIAQDWAMDVHNPKTRLDGFTLLRQLQPNKVSEELAIKAFYSEKDVTVLAAALSVPKYTDMPTPQLVRQVVSRLHELTLHENSEVRQFSIQRLADWDKNLRVFPEDVLRLLADSDAEVRIAAIGATSIAALRTEPVKKRLLQMLNDSHEVIDVRNAVTMNLIDFGLSDQDYVDYQTGLTSYDRRKFVSEPDTHLLR